jgi:hypothetical protein
MGVGSSIVVFAVGAVLRFAVTVTTTGFNLHTIGLILMIVGVFSFLVSLAYWNTWGGFGASSGGQRRQRRVTRDGSGGFIEEERVDGAA